jgi:uncharacterized paraquat-inducible protein A
MALKPEMICPHCQTKGNVSVGSVKRKAGLSFAKLFLLIFTAGISFFFVGLARKESHNEASCANCSNNWLF